MDLCCMIDSEQRLSAADLVTSLSTLLDQRTYDASPRNAKV